MKLRPEEITSILRERIEQYDVETDLSEVGTVLQIGDGIARIYGLENAVAILRRVEEGASVYPVRNGHLLLGRLRLQDGEVEA